MPAVSIICAPRDEAIGDRIADALARAGHPVQRVAAEATAAGGVRDIDSTAAIVVWTEAAAKLAQLRDQALDAMARGALIPIAFGGARPPGGFERLPPVDLSGWTGQPDDPRWRFVLDEVRLVEARARIRDGAVWTDPENATADAATDDDAVTPGTYEASPAPRLANGGVRAPAAKKRRRRFTAREVAIGATSGLIAMTVTTALLAPFVFPAPERAPAAAAADPAPSTETAVNLAPLTFAPDADVEESAGAAPSGAFIGPTRDMMADAQTPEAPATSDDDLPTDDPATPAQSMETLIAAVTAPEAAPPVDADSAAPGRYFRDCVDCPDMAAIAPGAFAMGAAAGETGQAAAETPRHDVRIGKRFAIGSREVTYAQWDACVADGGCPHTPPDFGWGRDRRPVTGVSARDVDAYLAWLSQKAGRTYRLPTEAEWEYAARAGSQDPFSFGAKLTARDANYDARYPYRGQPGARLGKTAPVASYAPNAFGLYDMHGNVWEWTADCWNATHRGAPADGAARQGGDCARRVLKGGAWNTGGWRLRAAHRIGKSAAAREYDNGFRVARDLD